MMRMGPQSDAKSHFVSQQQSSFKGNPGIPEVWGEPQLRALIPHGSASCGNVPMPLEQLCQTRTGEGKSLLLPAGIPGFNLQVDPCGTAPQSLSWSLLWAVEIGRNPIDRRGHGAEKHLEESFGGSPYPSQHLGAPPMAEGMQLFALGCASGCAQEGMEVPPRPLLIMALIRTLIAP